MTPAVVTALPLDLRRRNRRERGLLLLATLALGAWALVSRVQERSDISQQQAQRLALQVQAVEQNLALQLRGMEAALHGLRSDMAAWTADERAERARLRMQALSEAIPAVRSMALTDAQGVVQAAGRDAPLAGRDAPSPGNDTSQAGEAPASKAWFEAVRARPDPAVLFVSAPLGVPDQGLSLNVSVALVGPHGDLLGAIAATLDMDYVNTLLRSVLYASDMRASIVHGDGGVLVMNPSENNLVGTSLDYRSSMFSRHLASGLPVTLLTGVTATGDERMVAQRTLSPPALAMDKVLVLSVSRNVHAMLADWQRQSELLAGFYAAATVGAWLALLGMQRRRATRERAAVEQGARDAAEAERLRLALHGADLALWDVHIPTQQATFNERWSSMLGYAPHEVNAHNTNWEALLHPEDRGPVLALQQAHLEGRSAQFEATYRMRHKAGHWVWVLDRGRVVERSADGAPLRMVGTHMDISPRVQAEETLKRSEQSLAITLQSIGDAVIATDAQGLVTRMNDAARRLTGWQGATAIGQPLGAVFRIFNAATREPEQDPVARVLASGNVVGMANGTVLVARDGSEFQIADSAAPIRTPAGEIAGVVLVFSDVTQQYRMVQALRDREAQLQAIADALPGPVARVDREGRYLFVSKAGERWFGLSPAQLLGRTRHELLGHAFSRPMAPFEARVLLGETVTYDSEVQTLQGPRSALVTLVPDITPDATPDGEVRGYFVIVLEITERRQAQAALQRSEQKSRDLLNSLSSGVMVHAADTRLLDANPAACQVLGLTLDQMRGKMALDSEWAFLEEDGSVMQVARLPVNQVLALRAPVRNLVVGLRRPELAHTVWVLCSAFPLLDAAGVLQEVVVTFSEFSERKHAEEELQRSSARLRQASRLARLGGWRLELPDGPLWLAPETLALLEANAQTVLTMASALTLAAPAQRGPLEQALQGGLAFDLELQAHTLHGRALHLHVLGEPVQDAAGRTLAMQGAVQDVTQERHEQQQLRLLQAAVAQLNDAVLITEADPLEEPGPRIVFANPAFERLTGWRCEEVLGLSPRLLQGPQTDREELARMGRALQQHEPVAAELVNYSRDGQAYWVDVQIVPLADAQGHVTHLVAVLRDITERKQGENERSTLERQLREAQKMESIGTLAGGIAHDFNNILAAILGNVALASQDLSAGHAALESLDQIRKAGLRARTLVQQILTFSRRQPQALVGQPLQPVLEEALSLLRATLPAGVQLDTVLAAEPLAVQADATQLQQVVMNLCTNAWHALPDGRGRIEVGLAALDAQAALPGGVTLGLGVGAGVDDLPPGPCAHLWVRDNGSGMDAATAERIFDPFFTTKPVGQGTGLGLSVVHGIVRGHRGSITVQSSPGQGSSFHVLLPLVQVAPALAGPAHAAAAPAAPGAGQQVLYVDDDEVMGVMVQRLLLRVGYAVTLCTEPDAALALVRADPDAFDAVVSDFNMPGMSGAQLAAQVLQLRPALPVIISSGFITDDLRKQAALLGVRALLRKEQTLEGLVDLVQQVLAQPGS